MDWSEFSSPLSLRDIQITDTFWKHEMELVRTEVIPYQWAALNDQVEGAAPSYCMRNFKIAGKINRKRREKGASFVEPKFTLRGFETLPEDPAHPGDQFYGFVFQDSDFSKWIEAVGYSLTQHPDPALEKLADQAIDIVCAAQQEDGYLDTCYIIGGRDKTFTNLRDHHELYCFGHLVEGAVAYYQATGKEKLLNAARRYADFIADTFGPEDGKCKGYPGHEIAEMALVRLYEVTGEPKYLNLSRFFIDQRGTRPYYFDREHPEAILPGHEEDLRYEYNQAHLPVREQNEAVGHAVRAVYLYSGMADVARLTQDEELYQACERLWDDIVLKKMYITGGIGSTHLGEAFSFAWDLPNDTAYAETCASIGLVFFARRMLEICPQSRYADVMERALYNGILSGMALDGKSFFYVNPLEVNPEACQKDERKFHVKPVRQKWFGCACCPPNLARLLSSIASYAYTETENTLYLHLYIGADITKSMTGHAIADGGIPDNMKKNEPAESAHKKSIPPAADDLNDNGDDGGMNINGSVCSDGSLKEDVVCRNHNLADQKTQVHIHIDSAFPWDGAVRIRVQAKGTPFRLALRIPDWAAERLADEDPSAEGCIYNQSIQAGGARRQPEELFAQSCASKSPAPFHVPSAHESYIRQLVSCCGITGLDGAHVEVRDGYLYIEKNWGEEDVISLHFPMDVKLAAPDTKIREDIGKAAVTRGPIVYCMEEADNGKDLHLLTLDSCAAPEVGDIDICGEPAKNILWQGYRQRQDDAVSLYHPWKQPMKDPVTLSFIPYYMWANRSSEDGGEMQVWTRTDS
ncbi:MAG: glycoside hydrolase family 127 protein [Lachnospiraceae bacterium]|nr:glycoside hydrolase family 127 protein [Lachnospiraceae bacterium]